MPSSLAQAHPFNDVALLSVCQLGKGLPDVAARRLVQCGDGLAPSLRIIGQVLIAKPVATSFGEALVDDLEKALVSRLAPRAGPTGRGPRAPPRQ